MSHMYIRGSHGCSFHIAVKSSVRCLLPALRGRVPDFYTIDVAASDEEAPIGAERQCPASTRLNVLNERSAIYAPQAHHSSPIIASRLITTFPPPAIVCPSG